METKQTKANIIETFVTGFKGVLKIAEYNKLIKSFSTIASLILSIIVIAITITLNVDFYLLILEIKSLMINFLPSILGFTIAGYTLVVGFIQGGMLDRISEPMKDSKFSLYQKMSSSFALIIITQLIALLIAYSYHLFIFFDSNMKFVNPTNPKCVNYIALPLITFSFLLSFFLSIQLVLNIFGFSQLHHYMINIEKVNNKEKNQKKDLNELDNA